MAKFALIYHGSPKFETKEDGARHMTEWKKWVEGLGAALIEPGLPLGPSKTIRSDGTAVDGGGANPAAGFSVLEAATMADALRLTRPCPHLSAGGSIEIAEALNMEM